MLATFGFSVTGVLFILFALSVMSLPGQNLKNLYARFSRAYLLLAVAFLLWAVAAAIGSDDFLALSVVVGDVLLLLATLFMIHIRLEGVASRKTWLALAAFAGAVLLIVRTAFFYPKPFMTDGILFFNSQRFVSFALTAVFLLIWLPVNLRLAHTVTSAHPSTTKLFTFLYTIATFSAVIFMLAKAPLTVVLSFTAISVSFLMLIVSTKYVKSMGEVSHGK